MAAYGRTWWGKKWLDIFNDIDSSNRLPRGKNYATKGAVHSIKINNNLVTALVDGSLPRPYKITINFSLFSQRENEIIASVISKSTTIVTALLNKKLPNELFEELQYSGVELFPSSWYDIVATCSCPDSAMPCKHVAALIYILSGEIDKNPFLIFLLHNSDLQNLIADFNQGKLEQAQKLRQLEDLLAPCKKAKTFEFNQKILDNIGFAHIANLESEIFGILKDNPLFYAKNFKTILQTAYKYWKKSPYNLYLKKNYGLQGPKDLSENLSWQDIFLERWPKIEQWEKIYLVINDRHQLIKITHDGVNLFDHARDLEGQLVQFLADIPYALLHKLTPDLRFLHMIWQLSVKLIERSAFIPYLIQNSKQEILIRWVPALFDDAIKQLVVDIATTCPQELVCFGNIAISSIEQVKSIVSLCFSGFMIKHQPATFAKNCSDQIMDLFFQQKAIEFTGFSEKQIPLVIYQWLAHLDVTHKNHQIYLRVDDSKKGFELSLQISFKTKDTPISIYDAIVANPSLKLEILADVSVITSYIPQLTASVEKQHMTEFSLADFSPIFLEILPILKIMGVVVILPKGLQKVLKPTLQLDLSSKEKLTSTQSFLHLEELLDFDWKIAIGNKKISIAEFKKLLNQSGGFVRMKDQYMLLDQTHLQKLLKQIEKLPKKLDNSELLQAALSGHFGDAAVDTDAYIEQLLEQLKTYAPVPVPINLRAQLRPYQERGFHWMIQNITTRFGSILADDMGLGKTLQVITVMLHLKNSGMLGKSKMLIIAPTGLLSNWKREVEKFAPDLKLFIYHGQNRQVYQDFDLMISSFGMARSDQKELNKISWFLIVIDEAQNIKNPMTEQTKAIKSIVAQHKIAMSGTPVENRLVEYWSIFDFTNRHYLGSIKQFQERFVVPIERDRNQDSLTLFKKITNPFILRRLKNDKAIIKDLPDKIETNHLCQLTEEQTAIYQEIIDMSLEKIESTQGIERKGLVFSLINSLKQICNHPAQFGKTQKTATITQSGKMQMLETILVDIDELAEKTLIFTQYTQMGEIISNLLAMRFKTKVPFLHGGLAIKARDEMVSDFQNGTQTRIMIVSLKAGGTGLNLTAANHVIHYDLWWNPAVESQATDRAYRIGQHKNVMVHRLLVSGTFEEKIDAMIQSKKELANLTVESGENWITEMDAAQLKDLVMLRAQD